MTVHYADDDVTIHAGDCVEVLRSLPDASVDAVVTDPPYGLGFMGHEWDQPGFVPADREGVPPGQRRRVNPAPSGFDLDGGSKPGGHLLAFGGTLGRADALACPARGPARRDGARPVPRVRDDGGGVCRGRHEVCRDRARPPLPAARGRPGVEADRVDP